MRCARVGAGLRVELAGGADGASTVLVRVPGGELPTSGAVGDRMCCAFVVILGGGDGPGRAHDADGVGNLGGGCREPRPGAQEAITAAQAWSSVA